MKTLLKKCIEGMAVVIFLLATSLAGAAYAGEVTYPDNAFNSGDTLTASSLNGKFNDIKNNVNNNHSRISTLEGKSPNIGRIVVPVTGVGGGATLNPDNTASLPAAQTTTAYGGTFPRPTDYVSGDITVKAIISGCGGSDIAYETDSPSVTGVNIGTNSTSTFQANCASGQCLTVTIPPSIIALTSTIWHAVAVSSTMSSFSDINYPSFIRKGGDTNDTCTGDLVVNGFIIEYPRG